MPTRYLKESIKTSETIDKLSWFEEVLFYRLIVSVDDFGRYDGRASIIKNMLFPLKETITLKSIESAIQALANVHLLELYEVDGRRFLRLLSWTTHQSAPRATKSKYPDPINRDKSEKGIAEQLQNNCIQPYTDVAEIVIDNRNRNRNRESYILPGAEKSASEPQEAVVIELTLNTGEPYGIYQASVDEWQGLYPAIDVMQELRKMRGWLDANPNRRKTKSGIKRFINGWLSKEQDKGHKSVSSGSSEFSSFDADDFFEAALRRSYSEVD